MGWRNREATPPAGVTRSVYVARQAIFDRRRRTVAYELLARRSGEQTTAHGNDNDATSGTLDATLNAVGLQSLTGGLPVFINFTRDLLLDEWATMFRPNQLRIEILEDVDPDPAVLAAVRRLKEQGYPIVLDDFLDRPDYAPFIELADIVKVDFKISNRDKRYELAKRFKDLGIATLAEKLETPADFEEAMHMGFRYFQGFFFCKPVVITGQRISSEQKQYLRLMSEVSSAEVDFRRVEMIIKSDAGLATALLKYLNNPAMGLRCKIESVAQALTLLGERPLRKWVALLAATGLSKEQTQAVTQLCILRGRHCEMLAQTLGMEDRTFDLFALGLLSGLDALLNRPMAELVEPMAIDAEIKAALLGEAGPMRQVLDLVMAYEQADWATVESLGAVLGVTASQIGQRYEQAIRWCNIFSEKSEDTSD